MTPSTQRESDADWPTDPRVKLVYELLCDTSEPPGDLHWEGWLAERIVAALSALPPALGGWRPIPTTEEVVRYVSRYGGFCRDCADEYGICPRSGLPCGDERDGAIRHVIRALNYGFGNGFLPLLTPTRDAER